MKTTATTPAQKIGFCQSAMFAVVRDHGGAVDQAGQLGIGLGLGHQADDDGDADADQPAPERAEHVLGHGLGVRRKGDVGEGHALCAQRCPCWCR